MKSHQALLDQQYACIYLTIVLVEAKRKVKLCWNILLYNYNPCRNVATVFKSLYANDTHCNSSAWKADAVYQWRFDSSHTGKLAEDDRAVNCRRFNSLCLHHWQSLCFVLFTMLMSTLFQITHWEPTNRTTHTPHATHNTHSTQLTPHTAHTTHNTHNTHNSRAPQTFPGELTLLVRIQKKERRVWARVTLTTGSSPVTERWLKIQRFEMYQILWFH